MLVDQMGIQLFERQAKATVTTVIQRKDGIDSVPGYQVAWLQDEPVFGNRTFKIGTQTSNVHGSL